jgi:hypothetical protein
MMNDEVAMGSPSLRRKERFIMMSLDTLNKMKWEHNVLENLAHAVTMASTNQLLKYPFDTVFELDEIEGVPATVIKVTLHEVCNKLDLNYHLEGKILIWNTEHRKLKLMETADQVKKRMIAKVETDQKRFIENSNAAIFTSMLNENGDYLVLAKETFEPLGFMVSLDANNDLWVKDPKFIELTK